ncbi:MAG: Malonyl-CoA decarboxylase [Rhodospirillales bacterium 20-60-12]|nr:MAG: Malonyl-CoA decarboxylase [Rhodospirillales bacterium 20-60-12]
MAPLSDLTLATPTPRRSWVERLWSSIADRGGRFVKLPASGASPFSRATQLADALLSQRGEASGAAVARELLSAIEALDEADQARFHLYLAENFAPPAAALRRAAEAYVQDSSPETAMQIFAAAEPPRQELLRRMNMAPGGTAALVALRQTLLPRLRAQPALKPLDADLKHLFASWFNRGFLELRRIDWQTPAATLEKLITYEAVHEIAGWEDLRRRLAPDRRCFAFFHRALPGEPLIFVEVALTKGLAGAVQPLLSPAGEPKQSAKIEADTAIFYSISNCQEGLKGISFGNFLIKQVVEELKSELPGLSVFSTLSPIPGFRAWLERQSADDSELVRHAKADPDDPDWHNPASDTPLASTLIHLCAEYLTNARNGKGPSDPVARFHLGNGARLERINWMGNTAPRGMTESFGLMVNYLYDRDSIEENHEAFMRHGAVARSRAIDAILTPPRKRRA